MKLNRYTCYPGRNAFQLYGRAFEVPCITRDSRRLAYTVRFDESCTYTLPGVDQRDWNKGGGLSFDLFTNNTDSAMWAWRWSPDRDKMQLTAYAHVEGKRVIAKTIQGPDQTDGEVLAEVEIGQNVDISIDIDRISGRYNYLFSTGDARAYTWLPFEHKKRTGRTIGLWFGGNRKAPQKISVFLKRSVI